MSRVLAMMRILHPEEFPAPPPPAPTEPTKFFVTKGNGEMVQVANAEEMFEKSQEDLVEQVRAIMETGWKESREKPSPIENDEDDDDEDYLSTYTCKMCRTQFKTAGSMATHIEVVHYGSPEPWRPTIPDGKRNVDYLNKGVRKYGGYTRKGF